MIRHLFLVLSYILIVSSLAQAQTFYVATDGSDATGSGSTSAPWATVSHALLNVSDGSLVLVRPGTYFGRTRLRGTFATGVTVRSEIPYRAMLRNNAAVVTCFTGKGISLEGFDIAHDGPGAGGLVIQIQDLIGPAGGTDFVSRITIKNNVLHDSYNNDILKINNGAGQITVEGNVFYNQSGSDEHIDINSVTDVDVQDNIFFNDFAGSGRTNSNNTSSFIVIKDSNGGSDSNLGSLRINVRRNVFLNWEGSTGSNFLLIGEDGNSFFEAQMVTAENNLFLGNSANVMRSAFGVKGGKDITFRNNTVVGDLPALAYAMRLNREGSNPANENIRFFNNIWSDPSGTMGAGNGGTNDFSDTPTSDTLSFSLERNIYYNGAQAIPSDGSELINFTNDVNRIVADPQLPNLTNVILPRWIPASNSFAGGATTIREAFEALVNSYAVVSATSPAIDTANASELPGEDILGQSRPQGPGGDIGAYERAGNPVPPSAPTALRARE